MVRPKYSKTEASRLVQFDEDDIREMERDCDFHSYLEAFAEPPDPDITDAYTWDSLSIYSGHIDTNTPIRYGIELEVDRKCNDRWFDFIGAMTTVTKHCIRVEEDVGTFRGFLFVKPETAISKCGIEVVSVPATLPSHILGFEWVEILNGLRDANYGSARPAQKPYHIHSGIPTVCGLHIHINRSDMIFAAGGSERGIEILLYLIERFKRELLVLSRRYRKQFYYWTCPFSTSNKNSQMRRAAQGVVGYPVVKLPTLDNGRSIREFYDICLHEASKFDPQRVKNDQTNREIRYRTLNFTPPETIELRMWMGTLDDVAFHSSLMITDMLVQLALELCSYDERDILGFEWDFIENYALEHYSRNTTLFGTEIYPICCLEPHRQEIMLQALELPTQYISRMKHYSQKYSQPWTCYAEPGRF